MMTLLCSMDVCGRVMVRYIHAVGVLLDRICSDKLDTTMCFVLFSYLSAELDLIGPDAFLGLARNLDTNTRFYSSFVCCFVVFGFGLARYFGME